MFCAAMFPGQLVTSLDVSLLAQSSPYKKKLQTDYVCLLALFGNLAAMAVIVVIRLIGAVAAPEQSSVLLGMLPVIGAIGFLLILYSGVMYKFFIFSLITLYVIMLVGGSYVGFWVGMGKTFDVSLGSLPASASILLSFVFVIAGCGMQYLITKAAYKRPLSKYVFGASMRKQM